MTHSNRQGRILVVDESPEVRNMLARQILGPLGYQVAIAATGTEAIEKALKFSPDLIIASLMLSGLSGKDLLVALRSQGMEMPILVTAEEGREADAIQAFRLGACDYLVKPLRETEVISALERALNQVQLRQEREQLSQQLANKNQQLQRRVRELSTLYGIGKVVTSITNQGRLFAKLMEGCLYVTEANMGWMALQDEITEQLILRAQKNLPANFVARMHKPWNDGVSSLIMLSGEALILNSAGLSQSRLSSICKAVLIVPIKVRKQAIGVIGVARKKARPFIDRDEALLEAVADYASISLINTRLFQQLEAKADRLQEQIDQSEKGNNPRDRSLAKPSQNLDSIYSNLKRVLQECEDPKIKMALNEIAKEVAAFGKRHGRS